MQKYPKNLELEFANCPNGCSQSDELVLTGHDRLHGIPGEFTVYRCKTCGLERTTPRPTQETIKVYYPADYAPYQTQVNTELKKSSRVKVWLRKVLGLNVRELPSIGPGRMLEVGCSSGAYMELARNAGWHVEGIEFSDKAADIARSKGFNVQSGSLEHAKAPEQVFDIITAWMVLEHLHEPIDVLKKLHKWVKPEGYLVASIPDTDSLAKFLFREYCYDLHLPNHLFHFSPKTLRLLLSNAGWELERVFWQRNCNTLLWSFEYWSLDKNKLFLTSIAKWLRLNKHAAFIRLALSLVLGITRQSGRIEFWARPKKMTMHVAFWPHTTNKNIASYRLRCMHVVKSLKDKGLDVRLFNGTDIPGKLVLSKRYDKKSLEKALELKHKFNTRIYLDICDNHFYFTEKSDIAVQRAQQLRFAISQVDAVIVSSEYLREVVTEEVPSVKSIIVIGDVIEEPYIASMFDVLMHPIHYLRYKKLRSFLNRKNSTKSTRLVWFGNHSGGFAEGGLDSIQEIAPCLNTINTNAPVTLTIISNSKSHYKKLMSSFNIPTFYLPWNKYFFSLVLQLHRIAIIPIQKNPFTLAKTSNRVATSLVHGLDVVADSIPSYMEFKDDIYLDNWASSLSELMTKRNVKEKKLLDSIQIENCKVIHKWQKYLMNECI